MSIEIKNVTKAFGNFVALENISFAVPDGELVALLGPSGSGKTTLLRIIAGLENFDKGELVFAGQMNPQGNGNIGFVFQHYALFRHMNVRENIGFALRMQKRPKKEIEERVAELLDLIQLRGYSERFPSQLSGGQKQRVALARALAARPGVLLLDEPFGALDATVRKDLRRWLRNLHDEIKVTSVFVTHDQEEAFEVADRVVIMNKGKVEQIGTPEEVFHKPASSFVMKFLGNVNLFHGRIEGGKAYVGGLTVDSPDHADMGSTSAHVFIRPHEWEIHLDNGNGNYISSKIMHINVAGSMVKIGLLSDDGQELLIDLSHEIYKTLSLQKGKKVFVTPKEMKVFTEDYSI